MAVVFAWQEAWTGDCLRCGGALPAADPIRKTRRCAPCGLTYHPSDVTVEEGH